MRVDLLPQDQDARDRIRHELGTTLFVEAGAGSGKTTALIDRVLALVVDGVELRSIAAITFTEKAGAELRDRIRARLERETGADDLMIAERCRQALDQLDSAAIGTLHSFAQRLLTENPVEAGLPPAVEVADEVTSALAFDRRWSVFLESLLADRALARTLLLLTAAGVRPEALRVLAMAFDDNWDLVDERVPSTAPEPPVITDLIASALDALDAVCARTAECAVAVDRLVVRLDELRAYGLRLRAASDEFEVLEALNPSGTPRPPSFNVGGVGVKTRWVDADDVRARVEGVHDQLLSARSAVVEGCAARVGAAIRRFTIGAAAERRRDGLLDFHDLLVLARSLLRQTAVRVRLHERYRRILLDEFQDTDPIQIELAVRIAAADPASPDAGSLPWDQVAVAPGHLFIVGDPKQSIYRFRRADIATFLKAAQRFGLEAGGVVPLTTNFRSTAGVIAWINDVFGRLLPADADESQPAYVALHAARADADIGPPVAVLGKEPHPAGTTADGIRAAEARDVAGAICNIMTERWTVGEGRPASLGDITVLVPARTSLPFLEDALEAAGVPFRAESSSLVYASRAVRDLLMVLRAVDDPTDHLRIVSALRTPLFGCGDDDLFRFKVERHGSWSYLAPQPESIPADDPVAEGLAYLAEVYRDRPWSSASELVERVAADRRAFEIGYASGRPRDVWRRLRFVIDQARAWTEAGGVGVRQYLHWVDQQAAEGARVSEAVLPETDDDAIRIMTVHAAKGLEFPIVVMSGLSTVPQGRTALAEAWFPPAGGVAYRFGRHVRTEEYEAWKPIDEQMAADERRRLLYVACTRAADHLVVSLHRKERPPGSTAAPTNAELLVNGMGDALTGIAELAEEAGRIAPPAQPLASPLMAFGAWEEERAEVWRRSGRPTTVAATALTEEGSPDPEPDPGLHKRPRDLDLPPWLKGRYGTSIGRAVHGVMQTIDLAGGLDGDVDAAVAAQCEAEAVPDRAAAVRMLVRHAVVSPSVSEAARSPHWREVYVAVPVADRLLEGYVDLLYRSGDGLVVVDYKTASRSDPDELDRRVADYRLQGASYALAVAAATGEPVVRVTFVFLTAEGAIERHLDDLAGAVDEVRALVAAGQELVTD